MAGRQIFLFSCILIAFPFSAKADDNLVELASRTWCGDAEKETLNQIGRIGL
jgi:hypothetical protein